MTIKEEINRGMNQILVHSYLYSIENAIIDDYQWDCIAKNLVKLINENREVAKELPYYNQFESWTGDTSMDLTYDEPIRHRAQLAYYCKTGRRLEWN